MLGKGGMMKNLLKAKKFEGGWIVEVTKVYKSEIVKTTYRLQNISFVMLLAIYEGLKINKKLSNNLEIIAE